MPKKNNSVSTNASISSEEEKKVEKTQDTSNTSQIFNDKHFVALNFNEHARFINPSLIIGHALIKEEKDGSEIATQYSISSGDGKNITKVRPLIDLEAITRFGLKRYRAKTPDTFTPMYATRFIDVEYNSEKMKIACFSPNSNKSSPEPFWGSEKETPLFRTDLSKSDDKELKKEIKEIKSKTKSGNELLVHSESVSVRDSIKRRVPDQNTVMGESAKDAYEAFLDSMTSELHPDMKVILKRAVDAPLRQAFYSNYRPEWLHAEGYGLTPMSKDPQRKNNLGAAPKWANTEMMVLERIVKWFALHRPDSYQKIKPHFEMLLDSELIKKIKFEVTIGDKNHFVKLLQEIDPFRKYPIFRKPSDIAQGVAVTYNILQKIKPLKESKVVNTSLQSKGEISAMFTGTQTLSSSSSSSLSSLKDEKASQIILPSLSSKEEKVKIKSQFPTYQKHEKSIVQVLTTFQEANYDEPWHGTHVRSCSGTGFVIQHEDKKYVLTNAHCVENSVFIQVRLANDRTTKYVATRKCVSYQCDLALLEVNSIEFSDKAEPVLLGEMIHIQDKVMVVGFPMGGSEISVSKGTTSRIEVRDYVESNLSMLQVQVDAAINSGNSGGPVFSNGKVVGVAFQGYGMQGLGYMIPIPIIQHFLKEALSNKPYRGFPIIPVEFQHLENKFLRKSYHMTEKQTGVRVKKIDYLSDANKKLKVDDILLEINSMQISNEGTVDIPGVGNCIDMIHVTHMLYIGDSVNLTVLRKNEETKKPDILNIKVTLDTIPLESEKVPQLKRDVMPTYFASSGVVIVPLTRNYLEGNGSELEDLFLAEEGCTLMDVNKKKPDEEFVVINAILDCEYTQGYDEHINAIVQEINNVKINNIHDAVKAMEENKDDTHSILIGSKTRIVLKNMSPEENAAILKQYHIKSDRSDDLKRKVMLDVEDKKHESRSSSSSSSSSSSILSQLVKSKTDHKSSLDPILLSDEEDEDYEEELASSQDENEDQDEDQDEDQAKEDNSMNDQEEEEEEKSKEEKLAKIILGSRGKTPGLATYSSKLLELESKYQSIEDEENVKQKKEKKSNLEKLPNRKRLFQEVNKDSDSDNEDVNENQSLPRKRQKLG